MLFSWIVGTDTFKLGWRTLTWKMSLMAALRGTVCVPRCVLFVGSAILAARVRECELDTCVRTFT